jgi:AcrR family transcriptional regulator
LLDAALEIVAERGTNALTIRAVAERAGASPGTVSYHFDSSDDLLVEALEHGASRFAQDLERLALDLQDTDWDAGSWARAFAAALAHDVTERRVQHLACFELQLLAARRPELRPAAERVQFAYLRVARMALGALGSRDVDTAAVRLVAMLTGLVLVELVHQVAGAEERLTTALLEAVSEHGFDS